MFLQSAERMSLCGGQSQRLRCIVGESRDTCALLTQCDGEVDRRPLRTWRTTVGTTTIAYVGIDQLQYLQQRRNERSTIWCMNRATPHPHTRTFGIIGEMPFQWPNQQCKLPLRGTIPTQRTANEDRWLGLVVVALINEVTLHRVQIVLGWFS